jgi:hypothetical protein
MSVCYRREACNCAHTWQLRCLSQHGFKGLLPLWVRGWMRTALLVLLVVCNWLVGEQVVLQLFIE